MAAQPNAVELTVEQAWFIADTVGAGTYVAADSAAAGSYPGF